MVSHPTENVYTFSKVQRIPCPVHNGKDKNVSLGAGWAVCHSRGCSSKDILAALNLTPAIRWTPPPRRAASVAPLPAVSAAEGLDYLERIRTPQGATIPYQRNDGQRGKHWRNTDKRRNPGVTGDGWQARRFNPHDPASATAICLTEGEKDSATLAAAGMVSFCAPRGAGSLPAADLTELVELANATGLPVMLCGDNDTVGVGAMRRVREQLRKEGLHPIDTAGRATAKGSIADLPTHELLSLVHLLAQYDDPSWLKPLRTSKKYESFRCPHPKRWQGLSGDRQTVKNFRSCGNTATCRQCDEWEAFLHIERAIRGNPMQMVVVSGFGSDASTIAETVGEAKVHRERQLDRLRKWSATRQKTENPSKLKPRWDVHLSGDDDQLGYAGESLSPVLGE